MFAIRSLISAGGVKIDGEFYAHQEWTIVDALPDSVSANSAPKQGARFPVLQVLEIDSTDAPELQPYPLCAESAAEYGKPIDLNTMKFPELCAVATGLGIVGPFVGTSKADLVARIQAKQSENAKMTADAAPKVESLPTPVPAGTVLPPVTTEPPTVVVV